MIDPSTCDDSDTIERSNIVCSEYTSRLIRFDHEGTYVSKLPTVPPTAWMAKMSRCSSMPSPYLMLVAQLQLALPTTPIITADHGGTNPAAGVIVMAMI